MNKNKVEIKKFYCSDECKLCGEEECEVVYILNNKQKIIMRDCDPSDETIEDIIERLNND